MDEFFLKILSGNHQGAEIPLEAGSHTIGQSETCDLVLSDSLLDDNIITLTISDDGDFIAAIKTLDDSDTVTCYLNGNQIDDISVEFAEFDVLTVFGIHLVLGPSEGEWPDIQIPTLKASTEPKKNNTSDETAPDDEDDDDGIIPVDIHNNAVNKKGNDNKNNDDDEDEDEDYDEDDDDDDEGSNLKWLLAVPATLIILIGTLVTLFFVLDKSEEDIKIEPKQLLVTAQRLANEYELNHLSFKLLPDNTISITGYTLDHKKRNLIQKTLKEKSIPYTSKIIILKDMQANAEAILQNKRLSSLKATLGKTPGEVILKGYTTSVPKLNKIIGIIKQEIHGVTTVTNNTVDFSEALSNLDNLIKDTGLAPHVKIITLYNKIVLNYSTSSPEHKTQLKNIIAQFKKDHGSKILITMAPTTKKRSSNSLPQKRRVSKVDLPAISIIGVSMGPIPYVIMEDGAKYLKGAVLDNGYAIKEINLEFILMTKGSRKYKYYLGGQSDDK